MTIFEHPTVQCRTETKRTHLRASLDSRYIRQERAVQGKHTLQHGVSPPTWDRRADSTYSTVMLKNNRLITVNKSKRRSNSMFAWEHRRAEFHMSPRLHSPPLPRRCGVKIQGLKGRGHLYNGDNTLAYCHLCSMCARSCWKVLWKWR